MKCRLDDKPYCDKNFQIEFESLKEIESLRDSLNSMAKYIKICTENGDEIPPLVYRINQKRKSQEKPK